MTQIADKPFTQLQNLNLLDELRIRGVLVTAGSGGAQDIVTVTGNYTQEVDDDILLVTGSPTITLLPIASAIKSIVIKNDGVGTVTFAPDGSETVELTSLTAGQSVTLVPGGSSFSWVGI